MAITREKKQVLVDEYVDKLRRSQAVIVTEYRGLTHKQLESLRRELRGTDGEIAIGKNTLMARALKEAGLLAPESLLTGPTAMAFCYGEVAATAKILTRFARDSKILVLRGGIMGQSVLDATGVQTLTELPGKDQLRAQVVGALQSPLTSLVNVLAGSLRGVMNVLNARIAQLEKPAEEAAAA